jgi:hypothetical protein
MNIYYWTRNQCIIKNKKWKKFIYISKNIFLSSLIPSANIYGKFETKPHLNKNYIAFNGEDGDKSDYFCICKNPLLDSSLRFDGETIGFCKTNGKLYEKIVEKILKEAINLEIIKTWWCN